MTRLAAFVVRRPWLALGAAAGALVIAAAIVIVSGVIPITASSGHWPVTEWFLHFTMRRSVSTHAKMAPRPPEDLDTMRRVLQGAGHYEVGCRPCHGAPGDIAPQIPRAMTPQPPALPPRVASWTARELFYIVKHGVKFTGMPGWPAPSRDDEVWAVVAFLRRLPSVDARVYQDLVRGGGTSLDELSSAEPAGTPAPAVVAEHCARCHGTSGRGRGQQAFPALAGQRAGYLARALQAFADGRRHSGIMGPIAAGLPASARDEAARYYASLPSGPAFPSDAPFVPSAAFTRGETLARRGDPSRDIPSCVDCHTSRNDRINPAYPKLAGQYGEYLAQQLRLLQSRTRGGSEYVDVMHTFVDRLTDEQIRDAAAYFSAIR